MLAAVVRGDLKSVKDALKEGSDINRFGVSDVRNESSQGLVAAASASGEHLL